MIYETLEILINQINTYLSTKPNDDSELVLENIAKQDDATVAKLKDRVVVTLLNMEEEVTLKNIPNTSFKNGKTIYKKKKLNPLCILNNANFNIINISTKYKFVDILNSCQSSYFR